MTGMGESFYLESHTTQHASQTYISINPKCSDFVLEEGLLMTPVAKSEHRSHSCAALERGCTDLVSQIILEHCSV